MSERVNLGHRRQGAVQINGANMDEFDKLFGLLTVARTVLRIEKLMKLLKRFDLTGPQAVLLGAILIAASIMAH
jgi:hypothetical protein